MLETIIITYALIAGGINIYGEIEFNTLEDCEAHLPLYEFYDDARCVKITTIEY